MAGDDPGRGVLAEATLLLASTLNYRKTLQNLARVLVPSIADWCVIRVRDATKAGGFDAHVVASDPRRTALLRRLKRLYPIDRQSRVPAATVARTGKPVLIPELPADWAEQTGRDARHVRLLSELGSRSLMAVPLLVHARVEGVITLAKAESGRRFDEGDLRLAQDLARSAARAIEHARQYEAARDAVRGRDQLLAAVSHDLRNPLAAIKGQAQLLRRQLTRAGDAHLAPDAIFPRADSILASAESAERMISELVDAAHLRAGQPLQLSLSQVDLVPLARRVVRLAQDTTDRHRVILDAATPESLTGTWDTVRLERALANLVNNAIKYSPQGGEVTVRLARGSGAARGWAEIQVQDEGLGIPARELPRIFERFRRVRGHERRGIPGSGLGLATVRQIAQQHGGRVTVQSEPGHGSTFTILLPLYRRGLAPRS